MLKFKPSKKLIYLDHAATTPVRAEVLKAMQPFWSEKFGNPSSLYQVGIEARRHVHEARETVARVLGVRAKEVVFTAGGTESTNLAILGLARAYRQSHPKGGHIVSTNIEHHAVLEPLQRLQKEGFKVTFIKVDKEGFVSPLEVQKAIRKDTFLVSVMYANNEIGTVQPVARIGAMIRKENQKRLSVKTSNLSPITFHSDACQASGFLELNVNKLGVDLLSINASKIYGPKQVGALFVREGVVLEPTIYGGGQERGARSGTENVPGVVGFSKALELAQKEKEKESKRLSVLRDYFIKQVLKKVPDAYLNGPGIQNPPLLRPLTPSQTEERGKKGVVDGPIQRSFSEVGRLPNNINLTFKNAEGESVMLYLDSLNIAVSTGSACTEESLDPSHVLKAIGLSDKDAKSGLRITLGRTTQKADLDFLLKVLPEVVKMVRSMETI